MEIQTHEGLDAADPYVIYTVPVTLRQVEQHNIPLLIDWIGDDHDQLLDAPGVRACFGIVRNAQHDFTYESFDIEVLQSPASDAPPAWTPVLELATGERGLTNAQQRGQNQATQWLVRNLVRSIIGADELERRLGDARARLAQS